MAVFTLFKQELVAQFNSFSAYLAIGLYLLFTGMYCWVFPSTSILFGGYASMDVFFSISPYLFLFMVPAITMYSLAGERAEGTLVLLLVKPISRKALVMGKWLAVVSLCFLSLVPTVIYYISIYYLASSTGSVDSGAVLGSYIGLFLLACSFSAIGVLASSISPNVIIAYLIGVVLCFVFYDGFAAMAELVSGEPTVGLLDFLGLSSHYQSLGRGMLDTRDVVYLSSVSWFFLSFGRAMLLRGRAGKRIWKKEGLNMAFTCLVLFLVNLLANTYFTRLDFTDEKRFTLAPSTKQLMASLDGEVHVAVFLDGDLPAGFMKLRAATEDMLADLKAHSGGRLKYSFINPLTEEGGNRGENIRLLAERGIEPTSLNLKQEDGLVQKIIFPAAVVMHGDDEIPVNLLQAKKFASPEDALHNSAQNLEYAFVSAIRKATAGRKPTVAFTEGHGEWTDTELYDAMRGLSPGYLVGRLHLDSIAFDDLLGIDVIVVARPQHAFTELEKFKLDYFMNRGGRIVWSIGQTDADLERLRDKGEQVVAARNLRLDDLLFKYGIRFNYDVVADLNCGQIPLQLGGSTLGQIQLVPWVYYPLLVPLSPHPLVKNMDLIRTEFPGSLDTVGSGVRKEVLLTSSPYNKVYSVPFGLSLSMAAHLPDTNSFRGETRPIAVLLEGHFPSAFSNRARPAGALSSIVLSEVAEKEGKMIAIADGNVFRNQMDAVSGQPYPLGWDKYTQLQYGNKALLQNMVDYLADDLSLLSLRSKDFKLHLLDMVYVKYHKHTIQLLNVALPLLLLALLGGVQQYIRYLKFGR